MWLLGRRKEILPILDPGLCGRTCHRCSKSSIAVAETKVVTFLKRIKSKADRLTKFPNKFSQYGRRANIARTLCNQLYQSFDPQTSKAPSWVQDGMKAKERGHLSLIYLTFILAKIRHVLAYLSDIQWRLGVSGRCNSTRLCAQLKVQSLHTSKCSKLQ